MSNAVASIRARIARAAAAAGRDPDDITLIAVSKTRPVEDIRAAYAAGVRHFGENRVEELAEKRAALADLEEIRWHFIGRLQSRQTPLMTANAHVFHAVDRLKIAEEISKRAAAPLPCFLQVNVSGEDSKAGLEASDFEQSETQRQQVLADARAICAAPQVDIQGLMTMAPYGVALEEAQAIFARLRVVSDWLQEQGLGPWPSISMGMSGDFEAAIAAGATHVRIGGAIFNAPQDAAPSAAQ